MMADDLRSLAGHFRFYAAKGGATIDGRMCALIADNRDSVAETAEAMHSQPAHTRPAGVVSLAQARAERAARRLLVQLSGQLRRPEAGELEVVAELRGRPVCLVFTMSLRCATAEEVATMEAPPPEARS